jgi:hypothetical protein
MTKEAQKQMDASSDKPVDASKRSAVLAALSLLGASMGLSLNQAAGQEITQDVTVNKAKTADKAFNAMDGYVRGAKAPDPRKGPIPPKLSGSIGTTAVAPKLGGSTGPTVPPTPGGLRK